MRSLLCNCLTSVAAAAVSLRLCQYSGKTPSIVRNWGAWVEEPILVGHPEDWGGCGEDWGEEGGREGAVPPGAGGQARVMYGTQGSTTFTVALTWCERGNRSRKEELTSPTSVRWVWFWVQAKTLPKWRVVGWAAEAGFEQSSSRRALVDLPGGRCLAWPNVSLFFGRTTQFCLVNTLLVAPGRSVTSCTVVAPPIILRQAPARMVRRDRGRDWLRWTTASHQYTHTSHWSGWLRGVRMEGEVMNMSLSPIITRSPLATWSNVHIAEKKTVCSPFGRWTPTTEPPLKRTHDFNV